MIKKGILIVAAAAIAAIIVCQPSWLAENTFLQNLISHEVLALMAVIMTVTLASVANIHLALNRIVLGRFNNKKSLIESAKAVKKQMNDDAWYIFFGFVVTILLLILKGASSSNPHVVALANGGVIWIVLLDLVAMHDIYKVVFGIVELEMDIGAANGKPEDHSSESPKIGRQ